MVEDFEIEGQDAASELYGSARLSFSRKEYEQAVCLLVRSIEISPHFKSFELLGVCYLQIGDAPLALTSFKKAHELNPKSSKTAFLYAKTLNDFGESELAWAILDALLKHDTSYGPAMKLLKQIDESQRQV